MGVSTFLCTTHNNIAICGATRYTTRAGEHAEPVLYPRPSPRGAQRHRLGPYQFAWIANSTTIGNGVGSGPWFNLTYHWNGTGSFTVVFLVTDVQGHASSASLTVLVRPDVFASVQLTSNWAQPDAGVSVNLTLSFQGGVGPFAYGWIMGDGNGTYTSHPWFVHAYRTAGTYTATVVIRDSLGGTGSAALSITVVAGLAVPCAPSVNSTTIWAGEPVSLALGCVAGGTQPYTYDWAFGDGAGASTGGTTSHTFASAGDFSVMVLVNDSGGSSVHSSVLTLQVLTIGEVTLYIRSPTYRVGTNNTNGAGKELRLSLSVVAVSTSGSVRWVRAEESVAGLSSAPWDPLATDFLWLNVTATSETPTIYLQVVNTLNRTSTPYALSTNFAALFPGQGSGGGGGLTLGEMFLIAVGVGILALLAVLALIFLIRRRKRELASASGGKAGDLSADRVTKAFNDHLAAHPGADRGSLVNAVVQSAGCKREYADTRLSFLVETRALKETEEEDGRRTYTLPDDDSSPPTAVKGAEESAEVGHKVDLIADELARRGDDEIPLEDLVEFGKTLGLDKPCLAMVIDQNAEPGPFKLGKDPVDPSSLLVSLSPTEKEARKKPPVTAGVFVDPSLPANEIHVDRVLGSSTSPPLDESSE